MKTDVLYFGDNLEILRNREYFPDECIDLIYLDPPFNSKKSYNILFKENGGIESEAQIKAFTDTWHWTQTAENTYHDIVINGPSKVAKLIGALHDALGSNDVMAYLVMMTARLIELRRVLKPSGSLYLHCDPTASHYLKLLMDTIFGAANFRNEIIWKRTTSHGDWKQGARQLGRVHDSILFYAKGANNIWNTPFVPFSAEQIEQQYYRIDAEGRRYRLVTPTAKKPGGDTSYEWKGVRPPKGRYWAYTKGKMAEMDRQGLLYYSSTGQPYIIYYLDERPGVAAQSVWADIAPMSPTSKERLGYPTQKPEALLERIIQSSSNVGDVVLDPFCGCGTAVVAAHKLNRRWIGIDITHLAINLMRHRLKDSFGIKAEVIGEPVDLAGAKALASQKPDGRYQFQWWALGLIGARPLGEKKKGTDKGIDGVIRFIDEASGKPKRVVVQVKSGHVGVNAVRELKAVAANDAIGVFITLEPPTGPMKVEAVDAGFYHSPIWTKDYPKIQILTVEELLHAKSIDMPPQTQTSVTFAKAPRVTKKEGKQLPMG